MTNNDRELMKQNLESVAGPARAEPPPFSEAPDVAETLRLLERVSRMPDIRFDKVAEMRELIAKGTFETPERIDGAIRRLAEELGL